MGALNIRLVHCESTVSCQREHASGDRVSEVILEDYLPDEAWFLPRLYHCALKAGVKHDTHEMKHFSRWAFMRARDLGAMGDVDTAWELLKLAEKSSLNVDLSMKFVSLSAKSIGWPLTGKLCKLRDRLNFIKKSSRCIITT
jgi:hypothetical protein